MEVKKQLGLCVALFLIVCAARTDSSTRTPEVFDFIAALPQAKIQTPDPDWVRAGTFDCGEERPGIFMHPSSSAEFPPVVIRDDSVLTFDIGLLSDVWDKEGDGVEFTVRLRTEAGETKVLMSRYIDPKLDAQERRWLSVRIPLWPFAGTRVQLAFETLPGSSDVFDWAAWGMPQIASTP